MHGFYGSRNQWSQNEGGSKARSIYYIILQNTIMGTNSFSMRKLEIDIVLHFACGKASWYTRGHLM